MADALILCIARTVELNAYNKNYTKQDLNNLYYLNGLVQDCSNSTANALELLQSCIKPLMQGVEKW